MSRFIWSTPGSRWNFCVLRESELIAFVNGLEELRYLGLRNVMEREYDNIPGTYPLDSRTYRKGYHVNMFLMSLNKAECRDQFAQDERAYLDTFKMTEDQKLAVIERRYLDLLKLGANVYYAFKLISFDRQPPQVMYGQMAEPRLTFDEFQQMMLEGGRPINGNRSVEEWNNG
ncbi:MAG: protocatechuate 3,4-dioxygenase [Litorivicinaceae bacterium]